MCAVRAPISNKICFHNRPIVLKYNKLHIFLGEEEYWWGGGEEMLWEVLQIKDKYQANAKQICPDDWGPGTRTIVSLI